MFFSITWKSSSYLLSKEVDSSSAAACAGLRDIFIPSGAAQDFQFWFPPLLVFKISKLSNAWWDYILVTPDFLGSSECIFLRVLAQKQIWSVQALRECRNKLVAMWQVRMHGYEYSGTKSINDKRFHASASFGCDCLRRMIYCAKMKIAGSLSGLKRTWYLCCS